MINPGHSAGGKETGMYYVKIDRPRGEANAFYLESEDGVKFESNIGEVIPGEWETFEEANAAADEWEKAAGWQASPTNNL